MRSNLKNTLALLGMGVALTTAVIVGQKTADNFTCETTPHQVFSGDTLWRIAETKCDGNIQHATDKLVSAYGTTIQIGWTIYLPENENCEIVVTNAGQVYENC